MSERYSKLFALPENLYANGSPVVIAAGALLKDNQTGKVIAQLKMRNIGTNIIKAAKVCVHPLDTVGNALGSVVEYQYLDLAAKHNEEFGAKSPIPIADAATRAYSVSVAEVIFTDNTVWKATDEPWEALSAPSTLDVILKDSELLKQYRIKYGTDCRYNPTVQKDLWYCVCGELNRKKETVCHHCGKSLAALQAIDIAALKADRDARIASEKQKAAEDKAAADAKAKKTKKLAMIATPIVILIIIAAIIISNAVKAKQEEAAHLESYNSAVALLDAGQYEEAIAAFSALDGYKDSSAKIEEAQVAKRNAEIEAQYQEALRLFESGEYSSAKTMFEALDDYQDSQSYIQKCEHGIIYLRGVKEESSDIAVALETYQTLPADFLDVSDRIAILTPLAELYGEYKLQRENAFHHQVITIKSIFYENNSLQITYINHFKSSESVTKSLETTDKEGIYLIEDSISEKYDSQSILYVSARQIESIYRQGEYESNQLYAKEEN